MSKTLGAHSSFSVPYKSIVSKDFFPRSKAPISQAKSSQGPDEGEIEEDGTDRIPDPSEGEPEIDIEDDYEMKVDPLTQQVRFEMSVLQPRKYLFFC